MKRALLMLAVGLLACGKASNRRGDDDGKAGTKPKPEPAKVEASPACVAKLKTFGTWFAGLKLEQRSYEIDFGMTHAEVPLAPSPVPQQVDAVEIKPKGIGAWDSSESNHVDSPLGDKPDDAKLLAVLKADRAKASPPEGIDHGDDTELRIDVDKETKWADVVRVVTAAKAAGYTKAVFAFTASSMVAQPPGTEAHTTNADVQRAADKQVDAFGDKCSPFGNAMMHLPKKGLTPERDAEEWGDQVAAAIAACNCAIDPDEVKKQMWTAIRWGQAVPRVGVTVQLADGGTAIAQAATMPWSVAANALLEATSKAASPPAVSFAVEK